MTIRIVLADDHSVVREGIRAVIQRHCRSIEVAGEAENGRAVLELARQQAVDVFVLDIGMPELNGIETTLRLRKQQPDARVLMLSMHDSVQFMERALRAGAAGYMLKQEPTDLVIHAVRAIHAGGTYISPRMARYLVDGYLAGVPDDADPLAALPSLTPKEREVLQLLAEGHAKNDVARLLRISVNTAHVHTTNIMRKLDVHSRAELVRFALREGIIDG